MSHRERAERRLAAHEEGAIAYQKGAKQIDNPYKEAGVWSLHPAWFVGWNEEWNKDGCPEDRLGF